MSYSDFNHAAAVQAIVSAHSQAMALPLPATVQIPWAVDASVIQTAAREACLRMGFIAADAECLARAWQQQVERVGHFSPQDWPGEPDDFGMRSWPRQGSYLSCPKDLGLYAVLPDAAWVGRMAKAGVPTLQLRFKSRDAQAIEQEVQAAVAAVQGTGALLFINDHWQAAIRAGAYGVHLGQEDLDDADLRAIRQAGLRLGLSTHGYSELMRADALSPSYVAMGAVFPTTLKRMTTAPQGTGRLKAYAALMRNYPLVAIGGIEATSLPEVMASGVGSVAVVRAIVAADQPETAAMHLMQQIKQLSGERN